MFKRVQVTSLPQGLQNFLKLPQFKGTTVVSLYEADKDPLLKMGYVLPPNDPMIGKWADKYAVSLKSRRYIDAPRVKVTGQWPNYNWDQNAHIELDPSDAPWAIVRALPISEYGPRNTISVSVTLDKEGRAMLKAQRVRLSPAAANLLYIYARVNSRGNYRRNHLENFTNVYGPDSIVVSRDELLDAGLITTRGAGAKLSVLVTPLGQEVGSQLGPDYELLYARKQPQPFALGSLNHRSHWMRVPGSR